MFQEWGVFDKLEGRNYLVYIKFTIMTLNSLVGVSGGERLAINVNNGLLPKINKLLFQSYS